MSMSPGLDLVDLSCDGEVSGKSWAQYWVSAAEAYLHSQSSSPTEEGVVFIAGHIFSILIMMFARWEMVLVWK